MTFADWLLDKKGAMNNTLFAKKIKVSENDIAGLLAGYILPSYSLIVELMYHYHLNEEERMELFRVVANTMHVSLETVLNGVIETLVFMTEQEEAMKR